MKNYTEAERYEIAKTLEAMLGADLTIDEEKAVRAAIYIVSPEYGAEMDKSEKEADEYFMSLTEQGLAAIDAEIEAAWPGVKEKLAAKNTEPKKGKIVDIGKARKNNG